MCGICGILNPSGTDEDDRAAIVGMTDALRHRGPDDSGIFKDSKVALGHTRLSIVDLQGGTQPMSNEDGAVQIVFNGEIYNFETLRSELLNKGHVFKTRSDTEVLVHGYEEYGVSLAEKIEGMFAFAIWDSAEQRLYAARDRAGKKPFYYTRAAGRFIFASEIKSIILHPLVQRRLNPLALHHIFSFQNVPEGHTIFDGITKLPAAHTLVVKNNEEKAERYWFPKEIRIEKNPGRIEEKIERIPDLLKKATCERLMGDVPIGAFLSGGLDSSAVVAMMARCATGDVHTFSIGFDSPEYDETGFARIIAERFGTHHTEFTVTSKELMEAVPRLVWHCDEPFADSSILPTYYLSRLTRKHVTVALSGDGGDELFGGYERYIADSYLHRLAPLPEEIRKKVLTPLFKTASAAAPAPKLRRRLEQLALLAPMNDAERHLNWLSFFTEDEKRSLYTKEFGSEVLNARSGDMMREQYEAAQGGGRDFTAMQLLVDFLTYLPETLLVKVDRASMACGLEVRCPILSREIVELAMSLPGDVRVGNGETKKAFKKALKGLLPEEIITRRKKGFEVPLGAWFRGPLKNVLHDFLTDDTAASRGLFDGKEIKRLLREHESGGKNHGHKLWALLNVELWHRTFMDGPAPTAPKALF